MSILWLHVIAHLPPAWHVARQAHGWYAWRAWNLTGHGDQGIERYSIVETFGRAHGVTCGYLRIFARWF